MKLAYIQNKLGSEFYELIHNLRIDFVRSYRPIRIGFILKYLYKEYLKSVKLINGESYIGFLLVK